MFKFICKSCKKTKELSKSISDLKLMGVSSVVTKDEVLNGSHPMYKTTVEFYYTEEE